MTGRDDGDLVVRHVRLCECGKVADHPGICRPPRTPAGLPVDDVQPIDADDEDVLARRRRKHWDEKEQPRQREARFAWLRSLTLRELVDEALAPQTESTVGAGNMEPSRGGEPLSIPPRQQLSDDDPRVRIARSQLRRAAETLIRLRWEDHGWEATGAAGLMLGEHKDSEIRRCVGARPREVVQLLGAQVAGSARTVERVREENGDCRWCGQRWPSAKGTN